MKSDKQDEVFTNPNADIHLEGTLLKWTNNCTRWQKRHFVLRKNILFYYISKGSRYKGKIHLQVSHMYVDPKDSLRFNIDTGLNVIYLQANNEEERANWVNLLSLAMRKELLKTSVTSGTVNEQNTSMSKNDKPEKSDKYVLKKLYATKVLLDELNSNNGQLKEMKFSKIDENKYYELLEKNQV